MKVIHLKLISLVDLLLVYCLPKLNDVPMDFDTLQPYDTFIGSAAVVILSDKDSARAAALNMLKFLKTKAVVNVLHAELAVKKP